MLLSILLNAIVLGITVYFITNGQTKPDISMLLGLPIGLGIMAGFLSMFIGMFALIISFGITFVVLKWAFSMTTNQSLSTTGIWILWQVIYSFAIELL